MKTSDLPIGAHVAFDVNQGRDNHSFVEAYVIARRPRGSKSTYWGSRTGNHDTVGVMYVHRYTHTPEYPEIRFEWVRPQSIHMLWSEYQEILARIQNRSDEKEKARKAALKDRRKRIAALPVEVVALFKPHQIEALQRGSTLVTVDLDFLEQLVEASRSNHPAIRQAKINDEVASALALLG